MEMENRTFIFEIAPFSKLESQLPRIDRLKVSNVFANGVDMTNEVPS